MQNKERPITLILDCPKTGRTVIAHLSEDDLEKFIESCENEHKANIKNIAAEILEEPETPVDETDCPERGIYFYE